MPDRSLEPIEALIGGIIEREGGLLYTNRAADRGGPTKAGVTAKTLGDWRKLGRPATAEEVQQLEEPEIRAIYRHRYVVGPGFDKLTDDRLRTVVVDCGVLHGQGRATMWLQRAVGVPVDGVLGAHTIGAANARPAFAAAEIIRFRVDFMLSLALDTPAVREFLHEHDHEQLGNLKGWIRRAVQFAA